MGLVLVISSHVAGSRVGAKPVETALNWAKIDALVCPTVLLGRHPGWGPPGGGAVPDAILAGMIEGLEAQGLFALLDAVFTGYFASVGQIEIAAAAIARIRAVRPGALIVADPILGDAPGGLYVPAAVAEAQRARLVAGADLITPNAFELSWLSGLPVDDARGAIAAARSLGKPALVSSIAEGDELGAVYVESKAAWGAFAHRYGAAPNGTGDLLAGAFLAARLSGDPPDAALRRAVAVTADLVAKANLWNAPELPLAAAQDSFIAPALRPRLLAYTEAP